MNALLERDNEHQAFSERGVSESLLEAKLKVLEWTIYLKIAMAINVLGIGYLLYSGAPSARH